MIKQGLISTLNRLPDGTIELTITIPQKRIEEAYQKTLGNLAKNVTIRGFRKGKAPLKKAEEKLGTQTLHGEVLKSLIPQVYFEAVKEQGIRPIINPQIKIVSLEKGRDWQIIATTCELPKVDLKDYEKAIKTALASEKIWVPGKDKKPTQEKEGQKLEKLFKTLLATAKVNIPTILIEEEVNRLLSKLIDQTNKLGLTVEQYLASVGKTSEQLRQEYRKQAEETLKLEFILSAIADEEKIQIADSEVKKTIETAPDEATRKNLESPAQQTYLRHLLRKRKVIDNLLKL